MKVLHLSNVIGKKRGGGVHEVAFNFWNYQNSGGMDSTLWFPGTQSEAHELLPESIVPERLEALRTYLRPDYGLLKEFKILYGNLGKYDIIHQHGIWLPISCLTLKAKRRNHQKTIIQPHGYLEPYSLTVSKFKKKLSYWLFEKKNLENCDLLVACSGQEMHNLRKYFPNKDIAVIPNGISRKFFDHQPTSDFFKEERFRNRKNLLFLSRIHPTKGVDRLLSIFSNISRTIGGEWNLVIAGMGEPDYIQVLMQKTEDLKIADRVFFVGPIYGQDKINILCSADLFILPTFTESFGIVVAEALSKGLPAITTKSAPWAVLEEYDCGLWVEDNDDAIKIGLEKAMTLPTEQLRKMGENGKNLVSEKFVWENIIRQTIDLYDWVLRGGVRPSFVYKGNTGEKEKSIF